MKIVNYFLLFVFIVCFGCSDAAKTKSIGTIEDIKILKDSLRLDGNKGIWYYNEEPFSGYAVRYHNGGTVIEKIGFYNGKKEGVAKLWFPNGILRTVSHYNQNTLEGSYKGWWNNGTIASEATYVSGKLHGIQKKWHPSGVLAKKRTLVDGKENGLQQAWLKNGKLYVNYEARNGRVFGMRRANSCYKLKDEIVVLTK